MESDLSPDGRRAAKLVEALANEVTLVDRLGQIISSTAGGRGALGYEPSFWRSRNILDLAHPDDVAKANGALAELLNNPGGSRRERFRAQHIDGHWETVEVYGTNLLDDPDVEALVLSTRAVTREEQLRLAHDEAERTARLQAEYVASVSHELRAPLQGILGVAEILDQEVEGEAAELVAVIRNEGDRLRRVIDDIIGYARLTNGSLELDPEPTEVRQVARAVVAAIEPKVADGVEIVVDIDDLVEQWITLDDLRLRQVLHNLVDNARRFTPSGTITLSLSRPRPGHLACAVSDTGIGIDAEQLEDVFQPFQQAAPSSATDGDGLGLAIANRLVATMGGHLDVESTVGVGSTFSFQFPAPASDPPAKPAPAVGQGDPEAAAPPTDEKLGRALVVDDNHVNQVVIGRQLESIGFEVELAENGLIGVEKATAERFRVVIMDWHMPELDGLEATRRIRGHEASLGYHTPIVAMTASAMPGDREKCLDAGMDDFLTKPATTDQVAEAVSKQLEIQQTSALAESASAAPSGVPDQLPGHENPAAGADTDTAAAIDADALATLTADLGDLATVAMIVETYLDELDDRADAISSAVTESRSDDARREAHTLKSPSMMLGAAQLGEFCRSIENDLRPQDAAALDELGRLVTATRVGLKIWLGDQAAAVS